MLAQQVTGTGALAFFYADYAEYADFFCICGICEICVPKHHIFSAQPIFSLGRICYFISYCPDVTIQFRPSCIQDGLNWMVTLQLLHEQPAEVCRPKRTSCLVHPCHSRCYRWGIRRCFYTVWNDSLNSYSQSGEVTGACKIPSLTVSLGC